MRTRKSPRNQEILWRALGGIAKPQLKLKNSKLASKSEANRIIWERLLARERAASEGK